ncbi:MAG: hypothetical protein ABI700_01585 [Chloroflexota bacterium]
MKYKEIFDGALKQEDKMLSLRDAVIKLRSEGVDKETLLSELSSYRSVTESEADEDIVLEVMDFLEGWSSSHMRID